MISKNKLYLYILSTEVLFGNLVLDRYDKENSGDRFYGKVLKIYESINLENLDDLLVTKLF